MDLRIHSREEPCKRCRTAPRHIADLDLDDLPVVDPYRLAVGRRTLTLVADARVNVGPRRGHLDGPGAALNRAPPDRAGLEGTRAVDAVRVPELLSRSAGVVIVPRLGRWLQLVAHEVAIVADSVQPFVGPAAQKPALL